MIFVFSGVVFCKPPDILCMDKLLVFKMLAKGVRPLSTSSTQPKTLSCFQVWKQMMSSKAEEGVVAVLYKSHYVI